MPIALGETATWIGILVGATGIIGGVVSWVFTAGKLKQRDENQEIRLYALEKKPCIMTDIITAHTEKIEKLHHELNIQNREFSNAITRLDVRGEAMAKRQDDFISSVEKRQDDFISSVDARFNAFIKFAKTNGNGKGNGT